MSPSFVLPPPESYLADLTNQSGTLSGDDVPAVPPHPLGIKPAGNAYTAARDIRPAIGRFSVLPDENLIQIFELLEAESLVKIGGTCRALHAFSTAEELWKALFIESTICPDPFTWRGTWRQTYLNLPSSNSPAINCQNLFSDPLYRPFYCAHHPLTPFTTSIPPSNSIPRLSDLTPSSFLASWSSQPFILTSPIKAWPIYHTWSLATLLQKYSTVRFLAEAVTWPLHTYLSYMSNNRDESPLYLFDRQFAEKMSLKGTAAPDADFWAPECFGEDLFAVLGDRRPDSRWLIIGPERSGSTFHKDPNATSAWNAVIKGAKYWILFPSGEGVPPPPGVYVSEDQSEVTSPLSIMEWLLGFHEEARRMKGCREGVCGEGEVLHVPSGWWHLVVNLSPSIAITQNFIPQTHLPAALSFLRDKPDQVSGFKPEVEAPYEAFVESLRARHSELLEEALSGMAARDAAVAKKRKWDEVVAVGDAQEANGGGGFSFGFGEDEDDEVP